MTTTRFTSVVRPSLILAAAWSLAQDGPTSGADIDSVLVCEWPEYHSGSPLAIAVSAVFDYVARGEGGLREIDVSRQKERADSIYRSRNVKKGTPSVEHQSGE